SQGSLDMVMQFVEDMGPLDDDESIYCFYMALELLVLCTSANGLGSIPSTLSMLKDSIRDNVSSHPEWTSGSEQFMARFLEPKSPILLQQRVCDALDKALKTDPELIDAIFETRGSHIDLNRDKQGEQTDYLSMDPYAFEHEVARLFNLQGYTMEVTTASRDGGIDILGFAPGIGEQKVAVQCKRYQGTVGRPEVQQFWGIISGSEYASGYFVTTGSFSADAKQFTEDKPRLVLVDGEELAKWNR
ncbi:MAG: restriction endonuclease, partial [Pseudomonadales bacterium]|nr:restriction endonuclease [Pseudomonadales bacterium]